MSTEATLILIKPDGLSKSLTGNILTRLSEAKLEIVGARVERVSRELADEHYRELKSEPFYDELIRYIMGDFHDRKKVMAMVYWGEGAISKVRALAGATNPEEAESISIRGAYGRIRTTGLFENVMHASANAQDAKREIQLWFQPDDIIVDLYPVQISNNSRERRVWA